MPTTFLTTKEREAYDAVPDDMGFWGKRTISYDMALL